MLIYAVLPHFWAYKIQVSNFVGKQQMPNVRFVYVMYSVYLTQSKIYHGGYGVHLQLRTDVCANM